MRRQQWILYVWEGIKREEAFQTCLHAHFSMFKKSQVGFFWSLFHSKFGLLCLSNIFMEFAFLQRAFTTP